MNKYKILISGIITILGISIIGYFGMNKNYKNDNKKEEEESFNYYSYIDEINLDNVINASVLSDRIIDISDVEALKNFHTNVFIGTVDSMEGCSTIVSSGRFSSMPNTYGKIKVLKNLKGEINQDVITYSRPGGVISIAEYEKNAPKELVENRKFHREQAGQKNLDLKNTYVKYIEENDIEIETGKTYLFFATFVPETSIYQIDGAQYGTREILDLNTNKTVFRKLPDESTLQVKNNETGKYESLNEFINKYFK